MTLKQTLMLSIAGSTQEPTIFVPFPSTEIVVGDKGKGDKVIPNSQGLIRIFLVSFCLAVFSMHGLNAQHTLPRVPNQNNHPAFSQQAGNTENVVAALEVKALLAGPMLNSGNEHLMRDDLWQRHLLPNPAAFSFLGVNSHAGGHPLESVGALKREDLEKHERQDNHVLVLDRNGAPDLGQTGEVPNQGVVDWVTVELRDPLDFSYVMASANAILLQDGSVIGENGSSILQFPDLPAEYYLVAVRHRNHIGAVTDRPIYLCSAQPPTVDFTDPSLGLLGGAGATAIVEGRRCLWAGDLNGDGQVIYQGPSNDAIYLFSRVMSHASNRNNLANYVVNGYEPEDLNLDGKVIYQGPNNDKTALLYYTVLVNPGNSNLLANYIVAGVLP